MKIDRLIGILLLLLDKKKLTAHYLSDHFNVSIRTIQRDIDTLTLAGIPIYAEVGVNGGYSLMEDYKFDHRYLNQGEANLLSEFLYSLNSSAPFKDLDGLNLKFKNLLQDDHQKKLSIQLNPGLDTDLFRKHMACLTTARDLQKKVSIVYYTIDYEKSTRIICPHTLVLYGSQWYVYAYCMLRNDFRMFKLNRIISCEQTHESFELKQLPSPLPWEKQLDNRTDTERIVLEIDICLQGKLPDYFGPEVCTIYEDHIKAVLNFPIDEWVYSLLFGLVPYVKIIEPEHLKTTFVERLKQALEKNI